MKQIDIRQFTKPLLISAILPLLYACSSGGSDSDSLTSGRGGVPNSMLSLDITDAPVDSAEEVWIQFNAVTLQPSSDDDGAKAIELPITPAKRINLLELQGTRVNALLTDAIIPAGRYDWIRLGVEIEPGVRDSYILVQGNEYELDIPSGSQTGLKLNQGFELIANAKFNYTIDFDLRKSIVLANGEYKLKPTLRLINNAESATITGTVDSELLTSIAGCTDDDLSTGNAVYLFEGYVTPDDIDNIPANPISSALVSLNTTSGNYEYTLGFVTAGNYTISFTCNADSDDANILFTGTNILNVSAGQTVSVNF